MKAVKITDRRAMSGYRKTEEELDREPTPLPILEAVPAQHQGMAQIIERAPALPSRTKRRRTATKYLGKLNTEWIMVLENDPRTRHGKIIIPEQHRSRPTIGDVIQVGPAVTRFEVGDVVIYDWTAGTIVPFQGWRLRIMKQTEPLVAVNLDDHMEKLIESGDILQNAGDAYGG